MIFYILITGLVSFGLGRFLYERSEHKSDLGIVLFMVGFLVALFAIIWLSVNIVICFSVEEQIRAKEVQIPIYEAQFTQIGALIQEEMHRYQPHEADIFSRLSLESASEELRALLIKYPELKANEVIVSLAKQLSELLGQVYKTRLNVEDCKASLRFQQRLRSLTGK